MTPPPTTASSTTAIDKQQCSTFDVARCRQQFPALARWVGEQPAVYFDGPAGSQLPKRVIEAVSDYLTHHNSNHGGVFATSRESDALMSSAHAAVAGFLGAADPACVVFGANMTTHTFALSRALAHTWQAGEEVLVSELDHDANVTPWVMAARETGVTVRHVAIRESDCTLDMDDLRAKLSHRTRLVAVGCASNAVGTINPVAEIAQLAHAVGARVFLDAVHYAPHAAIDVAAWDCDFLTCSAYKFFGPHVGVLWGRRELLDALPAYKVRPASDHLPDKWMTGTQNQEGIAGTLAAIEYLEDLGRATNPNVGSRREAILAAYAAIEQYERELIARMLSGLAKLPSVRIYGITDAKHFAQRVPTVSITHRRLAAKELATELARRGIFVWHGNFYALPLTESLGLEPDGMVRIGLLHYNTADEVDRLLAAMAELERG